MLALCQIKGLREALQPEVCIRGTQCDVPFREQN